MDPFLLKTPSVGHIVKKMIAINPELTTAEIICMIRESIQPQGNSTGEFASAEMINETKALHLAQGTRK